jgi:hypothetical protein
MTLPAMEEKKRCFLRGPYREVIIGKIDWTGIMVMSSVRDCTANYSSVLSSEREPYMKKKESNCSSKKFKTWSSAPKRT